MNENIMAVSKEAPVMTSATTNFVSSSPVFDRFIHKRFSARFAKAARKGSKPNAVCIPEDSWRTHALREKQYDAQS